VEKYIAPQKGRSHVLRLVRELLYYKPQGKGTSLSKAFDFILKVAKRRSVIFVVSDYMDEEYWQSLKVVNRKHDLIGIQIFDPAEKTLPELGLIKVHDPETNESFWMDTAMRKDRELFEFLQESHQSEFEKRCKKHRFDLIPISTNDDYIEPIMAYFRSREKRR